MTHTCCGIVFLSLFMFETVRQAFSLVYTRRSGV